MSDIFKQPKGVDERKLSWSTGLRKQQLHQKGGPWIILAQYTFSDKCWLDGTEIKTLVGFDTKQKKTFKWKLGVKANRRKKGNVLQLLCGIILAANVVVV